MKKPFATPFIVYNYLTALLLVYLMITYNIGFWPFTQNLVDKSYLPNDKVQKGFTVTTLLVFQILLFLFIGYIVTNQHTSILMLISSKS